MNLPNATRRYKPAMLATLTIKGHPLKHLVVPADAIVRENEQDHVFVRRAGDLFALRGVVTGEKHQNRRVILEGLRDDEVIVTAGAFHLNSERKRRNIRGGE
jgi:cobalt-zinc-cadmium efflux system membrane fusion protein